MIKYLIQKIATAAHHHSTNAEVLRHLEAKLEELYKSQFNNDVFFLAYRNEFRVKYARYMEVARPKILLGQINYHIYPNFQSVPLLHFADVVSLSNESSHGGRPDRLVFDYKNEDLVEALKALPEGFMPDYFWDPQACALSVVPKGLERLPFPSVAGICHTFRVTNCLRLLNLYDAVAPVSSDFVPYFTQASQRCVVLDIPFGGNWGSFHYTSPSNSGVRDIDLLVSFTRSDRFEYGGWRDKAIELAEQFQQKHQGKYNVVFLNGASPENYVKHMLRAKIALNVVGFNGPYNYRTCEVINYGTVLMQMEVEYGGVLQKLDEYFTPDLDFISVNEGNFSEKLSSYLDNPGALKDIQIQGQKKLCQSYSYEAIHAQLRKQITSVDMSRRNSAADQQRYRLLFLSSAPSFHQHKREVFIEQAFGQLDYQSDDSIRMTMLALSLSGAKNLVVPDNHLRDPELLEALNQSYVVGLSLLLNKLHKPTNYDEWLVMCNRAIADGAGASALQLLIEKINGDTELASIPDLTGWLALDFERPKSEFDEAQQSILEYPLLHCAGNQTAEKNAIKNYMLWWCEHLIGSK
ncbi:MAG: hypothetical protein ACFHVJ_05305 [Aestuariibacter sp.]